MSRLSLRTKVSIACLACIALAITGAAIVYRALTLSNAASDRVNYVNQTVGAANQIMKAVVDSETGERGFLLTGDTVFLDAYAQGQTAFDQVTDRLRQLVREPTQRARIDRIQALFSQWKTQVASPEIAARRASPRGLARATGAAFTLVLELRKSASDYALTHDPATFAQWVGDASAIRNQLQVAAIAAQSTAMAAVIQRARTLAEEGTHVDSGVPPSRLAQIGDTLESLVGPLAKSSQANEDTLQQLTSASAGKAIVDQIRETSAVFVDFAESALQTTIAANRQAALQAQLAATTVPLVFVVLLAALLLIATRVTGSIRDVAAASSALADGDFTRRVRVASDDEVGTLARAYNTMAERMGVQVHETTLLSQMSELLQASHSLDEACCIIGEVVPQLFPQHAGAIYLMSSSRDVLESVASWGADTATVVPVFGPEDCWALRRGQPHQFGRPSTAVRCAHLPDPPPLASLCVPLVAQGETLGVLYLVATEAERAFANHDAQRARVVGDQIGLAVANLRLRETLRHQSIRDPLTGLYNRRYLEETLDRELRRADRNQQPLGVVMFDIDHFKQFNDTFGHNAGDAVLREIGEMLRAQFRKGDLACRYGGEEFVVVLLDADLSIATERAEVLRHAVQALHARWEGQLLGSVTLSLGVAVFPTHGLTMETLIRAADGALYRAKQNGRARVEVAAAS